MSFFQLGAEERLKDNQLVALNQLIDWRPVDALLSRIHKRDWTRGGGPNPYPPVQMFKALLLANWHQLSDQGLVDSLRVRLDFMLFTGFDLGAPLPDESTVGRFRNRLSDLGLDRSLFEEVNRQLEGHGLQIKQAEMAIVDATVIESANRPRRCIEVADDRNESDEDQPHARIIESADPDARWLKKGSRYHFGYKGFVTVEGKHGFIRGLHVTPANRSEVKELETAVRNAGNLKGLYSDKGYASKANRRWLAEQGIVDGIMYSGHASRPLEPIEKQANRLISRVRWKVEQCFGTLKRRFGFSRARYRTTERVESELYWKAICFNLLKAQRLLQGKCA